jgi:hypothetical protein
MNVRRLGLVIVSVALTSISVAAHHSFAMFDMEKNVEYKGFITEWKWQNPHVHFNVLVKSGAGVEPATVGTWDVEGGSINIMSARAGPAPVTRSENPIALVGHPMKDGSKGISLFYAIRPDGSRCITTSRAPKDDVKK